MGVRGLSKLIAPCGKLITYHSLANNYVAVDAFHRIYKYCSKNIHCEHVNDADNSYARAIINCITHLTRFGIIPIFIFDGMSLRYKTKNKTPKNLLASGANENMKFSKHEISKITPSQIKNCEKIINSFGLPCIRSPHEADSQCAAMTLNDDLNVVAVLTDDTDVLVFGAKAIIKMLPLKIVNTLRNLFADFIMEFYDKRNEKKYFSIHEIATLMRREYLIEQLSYELDVFQQYDIDTLNTFSDQRTIRFAIKITLHDVIDYLNKTAQNIIGNDVKISKITHHDFIDLCILLGTDYLHRQCDMSVNKLFELFVLYDHDIQKIIDLYGMPQSRIDETMSCALLRQQDSTLQTCDDSHTEINIIREYYKNASVIDPMNIDITVFTPDYNILDKYMCEIGLDGEFICDILYKYKKNFNMIIGK